MTTPVLTFFNNKSGVGKTSLAYHVAWMLAELDKRVLVADLDPQANLTAACSHSVAARDAYDDFRILTTEIQKRVMLASARPSS